MPNIHIQNDFLKICYLTLVKNITFICNYINSCIFRILLMNDSLRSLDGSSKLNSNSHTAKVNYGFREKTGQWPPSASANEWLNHLQADGLETGDQHQPLWAICTIAMEKCSRVCGGLEKCSRVCRGSSHWMQLQESYNIFRFQFILYWVIGQWRPLSHGSANFKNYNSDSYSGLLLYGQCR